MAYLGLLQSFVEILGSWRKQLKGPRSLTDWRTAVNDLLAALFELDDDEEALLQRVREGLDELVSQAGQAGFDQPVSLDVLRAMLQGLLDDTSGAQRFLTGRVTFCNMVPMRSIPFRVVCLIGMNGGDFPRNQRPLSFDLMARRLGLRLPEDDEIPEDREPFGVDNLERYRLRQSLLRGLLAGRERTSLLARLRGAGDLPNGVPCELLFDEQMDEAVPFVQRLQGRLPGELEPIEVDLPLAGFRLQGQLRNLRASGLLDYRFGKLKAKDRLRTCCCPSRTRMAPVRS